MTRAELGEKYIADCEEVENCDGFDECTKEFLLWFYTTEYWNALDEVRE